ncbi:hypothetical protein [Shinella zoogloeoides]|uniref:hypothetical protein n=1 Tax=Shinella zoogloeoides TaxID=352475 RepID=UPI0028A7289A|nr:hypothetical protein [Shinella zoogloeoides]
MSVTGFYNGNVQVPVSQALAGTGVTKIGDTASNDSQTLASVAFCNDNAGTVTCQLRWYDAANAVEHLVWQGPVETKKSVVLDNLPLRLVAGDEIRAVGNTGVTVTLVYIMNFALSR